MAFFCPIRIRSKKDKVTTDDLSLAVDNCVQPIVTSISSDALANEANDVDGKLANGSMEAKRVVLHDFTPCVDDELEVKRGQVVYVLYREQDWLYVVTADQPAKQGFIPLSYCTSFSSPMAALALNVKKKMMSPVDNKKTGSITNGSMAHSSPVKSLDLSGSLSTRTTNAHSTSSTASVMSGCGLPQAGSLAGSQDLQSVVRLGDNCSPFVKTNLGKYVVLYKFDGQSENDLNVEMGQIVTLLNVDDPDWSWIRIESANVEGFVPSAYIYPLDVIQRHSTTTTTKPQSGAPKSGRPANICNGELYENQQMNGDANANTRVPPILHPGSTDDSALDRLYRSDYQRQLQQGATTLQNGRVRHLSGGHHRSQLEQVRQAAYQESRSHTLALASAPTSNGIPRPKSSLMLPHKQALPVASFDHPTPHDVLEHAAIVTHQQAGSGVDLTDLVMLYDFKGQSSDDLSVERGNWIKADLSRQPVSDWLWAFAPALNRFGFVPKAYARPPAMTSL